MPKTSQRGLALSWSKGNIAIILLFVVALIAVGAGAYLYGKGGLKLPIQKQPASSGGQVSATPTPDASHEPNGSVETANWKMYGDDEIGVSFKYPAVAEVEPTQCGDCYLHTVIVTPSKTQKESMTDYTFLVDRIEEDLKTASIYDYNGSKVLCPDAKVTNSTETRVNSLPAYSFSVTGCPSNSVHLFIGYKDRTYRVIETWGLENNRILLDTILSTLKFTN